MIRRETSIAQNEPEQPAGNQSQNSIFVTEFQKSTQTARGNRHNYALAKHLQYGITRHKKIGLCHPKNAIPPNATAVCYFPATSNSVPSISFNPLSSDAIATRSSLPCMRSRSLAPIGYG